MKIPQTNSQGLFSDNVNQFNKPRLSPAQTTAYCGNIFSDYTLRRSRSTGRLLGLPAPPYLKIGSRICYEKIAIDDWINFHAVRQQNTAMS